MITIKKKIKSLDEQAECDYCMKWVDQTRWFCEVCNSTLCETCGVIEDKSTFFLCPKCLAKV